MNCSTPDLPWPSLPPGSLLKLVSIEWVMPFSHLILCPPLLLLPSIIRSIRVFSNEWALRVGVGAGELFVHSLNILWMTVPDTLGVKQQARQALKQLTFQLGRTTLIYVSHSNGATCWEESYGCGRHEIVAG